MSPLAAPDPDEQVRRLLADARHTAPIPDGVAARLEAVVASLHAGAPVDLAARRRGRRARALLVAAAAVVALGVGVGAGVGYLDSGGESDSGAASSAGGSTADSLEPDPSNGLDSSPRAPTHPVHLSSARFVDQVSAFLHSDRRAAAAGEVIPEAGLLDQGHAARPRCRGPGRGVRVPATYDGARVVLVLRPVRDGVRRVDLYRCGDPTPLRSTRVPVR